MDISTYFLFVFCGTLEKLRVPQSSQLQVIHLFRSDSYEVFILNLIRLARINKVNLIATKGYRGNPLPIQ